MAIAAVPEPRTRSTARPRGTRRRWHDLPAVDRRCCALAALLVASGVAHLGVQLVVGGPWAGPVSWRKPATFGLAFGVTLATLTWVSSYLPLAARTRARLLAVFAVACALEVAVITTQAWRGVPSHFNVATPVDAAFAYSAAGGGAVIVGCALVLAAAAARANPAVAPSMRLAVRVGLASFLVALGMGAAMIAIGVRAARTVSQAAAYTAATPLEAGHAATMHGVLVLPVLAWLAARTPWTEGRRVRVVALACAGYLLPAAVVVAESVSGVDPLRPLGAPPAATLAEAVGLACLLVAAGTTAVGLRAGARPGR